MSQPSTTNTTPTAALSTPLDGFGSLVKTQCEMVASWHDPVYSMKVVGVYNAVFVLVWALNINALTTLLYSAAIILISGFPLTKILKWKPTDLDKAQTFSDQYVKELVEFARTHLNTTVAYVRELFYWTHPKKSALITICLFFAGWFFSVFSVGFLIFVCVNCAMLRKPAISLYKKHAEKALQPYLQQAKDQLSTVLAKVPGAEELINKNKKL